MRLLFPLALIALTLPVPLAAAELCHTVDAYGALVVCAGDRDDGPCATGAPAGRTGVALDYSGDIWLRFFAGGYRWCDGQYHGDYIAVPAGLFPLSWYSWNANDGSQSGCQMSWIGSMDCPAGPPPSLPWGHILP